MYNADESDEEVKMKMEAVREKSFAKAKNRRRHYLRLLRSKLGDWKIFRLVPIGALVVALAASGCSSWTAKDTTATINCVTKCAQGCLESFSSARKEQACTSARP